MVSSTSMKYARALAEVAAETGTTEEVRRGLEAFREVFRTQQELREVLDNPGIPLAAKRSIVREVAKRMSLAGNLVNFLFVILERSRLHLLDEFSEAYQEVLDEQSGIARVEVRSSHPLETSELDRLKEAMTAITGKTVRLSYEVDQTLLGGVKLQVGSTVYDGTLRTQLEELRRQLASATF
jgi:F-type H+-transporting ATPase subunit delta